LAGGARGRCIRGSGERIEAWLASPAGLTAKRSTFRRVDVLRAICEQTPPGVRIDVERVEALADGFLASGRAVALLGADATDRNAQRYSTPELLVLERRLVETAVASRGTGVGVAAEHHVTAAINARSDLSEEQRAAVRRLTRAGDGIAVLAGKAGTGKTYALGAAREAWEASGLPVVGVAVARRAARELQDNAGIPSTSVAALLHAIGEHGPQALRLRTVVVIDEAGMLATRQLSRIVEAVRAVEGKVVLVGDHRQLPELEAGGVFRGLVWRGLAAELHENRRQAAAWEREAVELLRYGRAREALERYAAHGQLITAANAGAVREQLVYDWWSARDPAGSVMIALRRADVADLNRRARTAMRAAGALGEAELGLPGGSFAVGDWVVARHNNRRCGIHNGDRGLVIAVDADAGWLRIESNGRRITLDHAYLTQRTIRGRATLTHGYAITGHVAQGMTARRAFVLGSDALYREWGYTAMTRGREANRLYVAGADTSEREEIAPAEKRTIAPTDELIEALERSAGQELAIDTRVTADVARASRTRLEEERQALRAAVRPPTALEEARREQAKAVAAREALERRSRVRRWLSPGREAEASATELQAAERLAALQQQQRAAGPDDADLALRYAAVREALARRRAAEREGISR
jgi:hypothetical protein